jgi:hypothetical protein
MNNETDDAFPVGSREWWHHPPHRPFPPCQSHFGVKFSSPGFQRDSTSRTHRQRGAMAARPASRGPDTKGKKQVRLCCLCFRQQESWLVWRLGRRVLTHRSSTPHLLLPGLDHRRACFCERGWCVRYRVFILLADTLSLCWVLGSSTTMCCVGIKVQQQLPVITVLHGPGKKSIVNIDCLVNDLHAYLVQVRLL